MPLRQVELTFESAQTQMEEARNFAEQMITNPDARFSVIQSQMAINTRLLMICLYLLQEVERLKEKGLNYDR